MADLETVLQQHFGCKVPFRKDGTVTTTGEKAVLRLLSLLDDLGRLGVLDSKEPVKRINEILTHKFYNT
jgi:hypothetical protein